MAAELLQNPMEHMSTFNSLYLDINSTHKNFHEIAGLEEAAKYADAGPQRQAYRAYIRDAMISAAKQIAHFSQEIETLSRQKFTDYNIVNGLSKDEAEKDASTRIEDIKAMFVEMQKFHQELLDELPRDLMQTPDVDGVYSIFASYEAKIAKLDHETHQCHKIAEIILPELKVVIPAPRIPRTSTVLLESLRSALNQSTKLMNEAKEILEKATEEGIVHAKRCEGLPFDMAQEYAKDILSRSWGILETRKNDIATFEHNYRELVKEYNEASNK